MPIECYAQRLLNPFRGTMQVIKYASAEAVSTDGVHWDIYVSNDELMRGLAGPVQISDIRYGSWSADRGLKRGPLYPSEDFLRMEAMGAVVYEHLLRLHEQLPFPLRDRYEFWLLDQQGLPLALLDSALSADGMALDRSIEWRPGMAARDRFRSPAMGGLADMAAADYLARYLKERAGPRPAAGWFRRDAEGIGTALEGVNLVDGWEGRCLASGCFPELLLAPAGQDDPHQRLIEDFQAWQAVWLLTLPLPAGVRARIEPHVRQQAELVEGLCRLYPKTVDAAVINAARIEALILQSKGREDGPAPDQMSTFYIELNPAGGHYT